MLPVFSDNRERIESCFKESALLDLVLLEVKTQTFPSQPVQIIHAMPSLSTEQRDFNTTPVLMLFKCCEWSIKWVCSTQTAVICTVEV